MAVITFLITCEQNTKQLQWTSPNPPTPAAEKPSMSELYDEYERELEEQAPKSQTDPHQTDDIQPPLPLPPKHITPNTKLAWEDYDHLNITINKTLTNLNSSSWHCNKLQSTILKHLHTIGTLNTNPMFVTSGDNWHSEQHHEAYLGADTGPLDEYASTRYTWYNHTDHNQKDADTLTQIATGVNNSRSHTRSVLLQT